jgi:hypothetical protein
MIDPQPDESGYSPPPPTQPPPYGTGPSYPYYGHPAPPGYPGYAPYAFYPPPPLARQPLVSDPLLGWLLLAAAALAAVAAVLPWATVFTRSFPGTDGDGVLVILCAIVLATCALVIGLGHGRLWASITPCVFAVFITLIGLVDLANVSNVVRSIDAGFLSGSVSVGAGLWLTTAVGMVAMGLSITAIVRRRARG